MPACPNSSTRDAINRAVSFLVHQQDRNGAYAFRMTLDPTLQNNFREFPSVFTSQQINTSLEQVDPHALRPIIKKGLQYLESEVLLNGAWKFAGRDLPNLPPDTDDTANTAYLLKKNGISFPATNSLLLGNRNRKGLFYTWIFPRVRHIVFPRLWGKLFLPTLLPGSRIKPFQRGQARVDDVDVVVNANAVLYLGESKATAPAIRWILQVVKDGSEAQSDRWYQSRYPLYYSIMRCGMAGIQAFSPVYPLIVNRLQHELEEKGYCGEGPTDTALAASVLTYLAPRFEYCKAASSYLLEQQNTDGSWPIAILYYSGWIRQNDLFWGSRAVTTGFCAEALARILKLP